MLLRIAAFEVQTRLRMMSTYVYFLLFGALSALWMAAASGAFPHASVSVGAGGKVMANAPYSMLMLTLVMALFMTVTVAAVAGRATFQDIDHRSTALFFTKPISKLAYLGGRYLGAVATMCLIYPSIALGTLLIVHSPFPDPTRIGPDSLAAYGWPYLVIVLPNLLLSSSIFFALSTLLKRMLPVYVGGIVLLLGYLLALNLTADLDDRTAAALLDPFGVSAVEVVARYWTIAEKNARIVPLTGLFLANRAIWMSLSAIVLVVTYRAFSFAERGTGTREPEVVRELAPANAVIPSAHLEFSERASFSMLGSLTRLQFRETVRNVFFLVILLAGILFVIIAGQGADEAYGTKIYPVTPVLLKVVGGSFSIFLLIIIAFSSGELVWRERDTGIAPIVDATPVKRWVLFTSKLFALMLVQGVLLCVVALAGVTLQAGKGYFHFEPLIYVKTLGGVLLPGLLFLCCLAMLVHVVANNKYVGHFVMILLFALGIALPLLGYERLIYRLFALPPAPYSAMNGFGHFVRPVMVFEAYWAALAILLAILANALWVRGAETAWAKRLTLLRTTLSPAAASSMALCFVAFASLGVFIQWNTDHLNRYRDSHTQEVERVDYEKRFKSWQDRPQPKVRAVSINADIFPDERRVHLHGTYALENDSNEDIPEVLVDTLPTVRNSVITFGLGEHVKESLPEIGLTVYALGSPLKPKAKATFTFDVTYENPGFVATGSDTHIIANGTFIDRTYCPSIGYAQGGELTDDTARKRNGLEPRVPLKLGDPHGTSRNALIPGSDWVDFDATVSTKEGQLPIAPGYVDRDWTEGGRHYRHYQMDSKMVAFWAFLSADYAVITDKWTPPPSAMPGSPEVAIEIDYQKEHTYNTARMVKGIKKSLDYYTTHYGPYQHHQVRIVEFPSYERFAEAFPNTIPLSESIGFITKVDDKDQEGIDMPFFVTAHEVAHQWWGHQVVGADVEGAAMIIESMAEYSALMVMKQEYGPEHMRRFLRYELDRYLTGRSTTRRAERPLVTVDSEAFIHYSKGSLTLYALSDYIGEDVVNGALAKFIAKHKFETAPYTDAGALVEALRSVTPPEYAYLIHDLFETITLYDNRATRATAKKRDDGKYDVTVNVLAKKLRAGDLGAETDIPIDDFIDIGATGDKGAILAIERKHIDAPESEFTFVVSELPKKAGIDPLHKLIDRLPDDNVIAVE